MPQTTPLPPAPAIPEPSRRLPTFLGGKPIQLADGQAWAFPSPDSVPGYRDAAHEMAREAARAFAGMADFSPGRDASGLSGDAVTATLDRALAPYRIIVRAATLLLRANYDLSDAEIAGLLPFDYHAADRDDPDSPLSRATPGLLAVCNRVAAVLGIDVGAELAAAGRAI